MFATANKITQIVFSKRHLSKAVIIQRWYSIVFDIVIETQGVIIIKKLPLGASG